MLGTIVRVIPLQTFDSATVNNTFQAINSDGLDATCFYIRIVNDSDKTITLSWDGLTDHELIAAHTSWELNAQQNARPSAQMCNVQKGQIFYVAGTAGTGTISLSGYYV